jgi:hypothetical protein
MKSRRQNLMPVVIALTLALLAHGVSASDTPATTPLPVSMSRIRQALAKPARLHLTVPPPEPPTFRVAIREHLFYTEKPYKWDFGNGGYPPRNLGRQVAPSSTPPLFTVDLLPLALSAVKAIKECATTEVCD